MDQQDTNDEEMLQRAGDSATRLLRHLCQHASGGQGPRTMPEAAAAMTPAGDLEKAIEALRDLIAVLHKEPARQ